MSSCDNLWNMPAFLSRPRPLVFPGYPVANHWNWTCLCCRLCSYECECVIQKQLFKWKSSDFPLSAAWRVKTPCTQTTRILLTRIQPWFVLDYKQKNSSLKPEYSVQEMQGHRWITWRFEEFLSISFRHDMFRARPVYFSH